MTLLGELEALEVVPRDGSLADAVLGHAPAEQAEAPRPTLADFGLEGGEVTAGTVGPEAPDWTAVLRELLPPGFDAEDYEIVEDSVRLNAWDVYSKKDGVQRLYSWRARVRRRTDAYKLGEHALDLARQLVTDRVRPRKPRKRRSAPPSALVVPIGDTQWGKADGDGVDGTLRRYARCIEGVVERVAELRSSGHNLAELWLPGLGDLIEGCGGDPNYPGQDHQVRLNYEDQRELAEILLLDTFDALAPLFPVVKVPVVPGNHDEHRKGGKRATDDRDNACEGVYRQAARVLARDPKMRHLEVITAQGEMSLTLDVCGTVTTFCHGHKYGRGASPADKAHGWWAQQAHNLLRPGRSTLLLSGHYHHLVVDQRGAKTFIQIPALDGGSKWWTDMAGADSPAGMISLVVGQGGWSDLQVHG